MKTVILMTATVAIFCSQATYAQGLVTLKGYDRDAPVDWSAATIELNSDAKRVNLSGNVIFRQSSLKVTSDKMTFTYVDSPVPNSNPGIERVIANNSVKVNLPDIVASGDLGIFDVERNILTLVGNVTLSQRENQLNGERLVIDLNSGMSSMSSRSTQSGKTADRNERVTGRFVVPKRKL
jgi:lipopolysaccharide export system protein LptA